MAPGGGHRHPEAPSHAPQRYVAAVARPAVTVICPFAGDQAAFDRVLAALGTLRLAPGDEVLLADNRRAARPCVAGDVRVVDASGPASSYHARAVAAARARTDWLLFVDADCEPRPDLLDAYFTPEPAASTGVVAGGIVDWVTADTAVARYVAARRKLDQATTLAHPRGGYAQTANCLVRRAAFEAVGGFPEAVRSGGDADLCWRLAAAGWGLEERPAARVRHRNRAALLALLGQIHRHGAGMRWLDGRWPGAFPRPTARELAGRVRILQRRTDGLAYAALDVACLTARDLGRLRSNDASVRRRGGLVARLPRRRPTDGASRRPA
jgi:hypothetical protein